MGKKSKGDYKNFNKQMKGLKKEMREGHEEIGKTLRSMNDRLLRVESLIKYVGGTIVLGAALATFVNQITKFLS